MPINLDGYGLPRQLVSAIDDIVQAYLLSGDLQTPAGLSQASADARYLKLADYTPGGSGGGVVAKPYSTTITTDGQWDIGTATLTANTAYITDDSATILSGSTTWTVIAGSYTATFDGTTPSTWLTGANRNLCVVCRIGDTVATIINGTVVNARAAAAVVTPVAPSFASAPVVASAQVDSPVSYTVGTISGTPTPAVTRQWTLNGANISGATGATYTPVGGDATGVLRVVLMASNSAGIVSSTSNAVTVAAAPAMTAPGAPTGLTLGTIGQTSVPITWTAPDSNGGSAITSYRIGVRTPAGSGAYTYTATGSVATSGTATGLAAGQTFDVVVQAVNAIGNSADSTLTTGTAAAAGLTAIAGLFATLTNTTDTTGTYTASSASGQACYGVGKSAAGDFVLEADWLGYGGTYLAWGVSANASAPSIWANTDRAWSIVGADCKINNLDSGATTLTGRKPATITNLRQRITRTGTTIVWDDSIDGGATWTVQKTVTGISGVLYPKIGSSGSTLNSLVLRGSGFA